MLNINEVVYYGRYFSDEKNNYEIIWWLCLDDYKVYNSDLLLTDYSYKNIFEIKESLKFIPFFKTDIIKLEKDFICSLNNKTVLKEFNKLLLSNNNEYDLAFKKFVERTFLFDSWKTFEKKQLINDAIAWCINNNIPYTDNI